MSFQVTQLLLPWKEGSWELSHLLGARSSYLLLCKKKATYKLSGSNNSHLFFLQIWVAPARHNCSAFLAASSRRFSGGRWIPFQAVSTFMAGMLESRTLICRHSRRVRVGAASTCPGLWHGASWSRHPKKKEVEANSCLKPWVPGERGVLFTVPWWPTRNKAQTQGKRTKIPPLDEKVSYLVDHVLRSLQGWNCSPSL